MKKGFLFLIGVIFFLFVLLIISPEGVRVVSEIRYLISDSLSVPESQIQKIEFEIGEDLGGDFHEKEYSFIATTLVNDTLKKVYGKMYLGVCAGVPVTFKGDGESRIDSVKVVAGQ